MNRLLVLSALASIALAAPSLLGAGLELPKESSSTILRQKKSPTFGHHGSSVPVPVPIHEYGMQPINHGMPPLMHQYGMSPHMGAYQKPIIVKQKGGYHLFRDSDEEQQQVGIKEKCKKQVKVKLCDASGEESFEGAQLTQNSMEKSIKMAKQAVENLQKGLRNMEESSSLKMAQWKHADVDTEIHEDIEVAKEALEHIEKNFGNLESLSLQSEKSKNVDLKDVSMTKADEERVAQWKEAIVNIQKNVEIARNIEDSFKDEMKHSAEDTDNHKMMMKSSDLATGETIQKQKLLDETSENKKFLEKHAENLSEDLKTSVSKPIPSKSIVASQKSVMPEDNLLKKEKSSTLDMTEKNEKKNRQTMIMNAVDTPTSEVKTPLKEKTSEDILDSDTAPSTIITQTLKTENMIEENEQENIHLGKNADVFENKKVDNILTEQKSTKIEKEQRNHESLEEESMKPEINSFPPFPPFRSALTVEKPVENSVKGAPATETKSPHKDISTTLKHAEVNSDLKSSLDIDDNLSPKEALDDLKSTNSLNLKPASLQKEDSHFDHLNLNAHDQHIELSKAAVDLTAALNNDVPIIVKPPKNQEESPEMKAIDDHFAITRMDSNTNLPGSLDQGSLVKEAMTQHTHGKSVDNFMEPSMQLRMRDIKGKSALERIKMLQWKHNDAARSSYGGYGAEAGQLGGFGGGSRGGFGSGISPSSGSSGAIGVFPNANVGGCGIPLMLSCSPSVVSGHMASAQPASTHASYSAPIPHSSSGYGAPAASSIFSSQSSFSAPSYRATEEIDLKKKQQIHDFEALSSKVKRNLSTMKLKDLNKKNL